ncbi:MAG: hypothetical protein IKH21_07610, partial [Clostridia bacterium]|nr:hypothetical protein [Clostridia bacterium]
NSSRIRGNDPFVFSAFCILPQSHLPLRREGRESAAQLTFINQKKQSKENNSSGAAALPRRATSPGSGEADCLTTFMPDLQRLFAKEPSIHSHHIQ